MTARSGASGGRAVVGSSNLDRALRGCAARHMRTRWAPSVASSNNAPLARKLITTTHLAAIIQFVGHPTLRARAGNAIAALRLHSARGHTPIASARSPGSRRGNHDEPIKWAAF